MSAQSKAWRQRFNDECLRRDGYRCVVCGLLATPSNWRDVLDVHHIFPRKEMPNGGYVKENGITLCKHEPHGCHLKAEQWHMTDGKNFPKGFHPDDLYDRIASSFDEAWAASEKLGGSYDHA
jgi:5-methylcytosine-specific restriction endonuclease McrA